MSGSASSTTRSRHGRRRRRPPRWRYGPSARRSSTGAIFPGWVARCSWYLLKDGQIAEGEREFADLLADDVEVRLSQGLPGDDDDRLAPPPQGPRVPGGTTRVGAVRAGSTSAAACRDADERLRAERALQLAIQVCLDVAAHIVAELGLVPPAEYRQAFVRLGEAGVADAELMRRLADAARLGNLLVHGYADLDDAAIFAALDGLDDLREFAAAMLREAERS